MPVTENVWTLMTAPRSSGADEPRDRGRRLGDLVLGLAAALVDRVGHAVAEVLLEQGEGERVQGALGRRHLGQDVDAVGVGVDEAPQTADLAFDPAQPGDVGRLVLGVTGGVIHQSTSIPSGGMEPAYPLWVSRRSELLALRFLLRDRDRRPGVAAVVVAGVVLVARLLKGVQVLLPAGGRRVLVQP